MKYVIQCEQETDGRWIAEIVDLAGVLAYGSVKEEAVAKVEALALRVLAEQIEHKELVPDLSISFMML